jgi:hypothetical protein
MGRSVFCESRGRLARPATRLIASRVRSRLLTLTFDIGQLPAPKNWAIAGRASCWRTPSARAGSAAGPSGATRRGSSISPSDT